MLRYLANLLALKIIRRVFGAPPLPQPTPAEMRLAECSAAAFRRTDGSWLCCARGGDVRVYCVAPDRYAAEVTIKTLVQLQQRASVQQCRAT